VSTFQGHAGSVLNVDFLSGGNQVVSAGADGLLKVWTLRTSECEATLDAHADKVWALCVRSDGAQLVTGGADSVLNVWRDVTARQDDAAVAAAEKRVLKEHDLVSSMGRKDFAHAAGLAFELGHSYRLWTVLKDLLESGGTFDPLVAEWDDARLAQGLGFLRDWNTNATKAGVAQALLAAVLRAVPLPRLKGVVGAGALVEGLASYTERHFARVDKLVQASFVIDYTCAAMSAIGAASANEE
jgi:U3 small nucleolar RNA-associated protein 13